MPNGPSCNGAPIDEKLDRFCVTKRYVQVARLRFEGQTVLANGRGADALPIGFGKRETILNPYVFDDVQRYRRPRECRGFWANKHDTVWLIGSRPEL